MHKNARIKNDFRILPSRTCAGGATEIHNESIKVLGRFEVRIKQAKTPLFTRLIEFNGRKFRGILF